MIKIDTNEIDASAIIEQYARYLEDKQFPCIAAKAALAWQQVKCIVAGNMASSKHDHSVLQFLYDFVDGYQKAKTLYHSAAIIFTEPVEIKDDLFDGLLWQRLQALADLDATMYSYDKRVDRSPSSPQFSFSIKGEALYIIGLHPNSSRESRKFGFPALVFNPHAQFEKLRQSSGFERMKNVVRKRDISLCGSINPMLKDFGECSEVYQYSGRIYDEAWKCPLKINHAATTNNPAP